MTWATVFFLAAGAFGLKAAGFFGMGRLGARPTIRMLGALLPPALLAALITVQTVSVDNDLVIDARLAGVVAGGVAAWRKAPFWLVVALAAVVTGGIRAL
jgi:hypothetical protein